MCGIAGFFGHREDRRSCLGLLRTMIGTLRHRGPDGEGIFCDGDAGLAHARLSIIDIAGGAQPMSNVDGSVRISFNGEIFNYVELRRDLAERGRAFRTSSDTEVLLALYEEYGPACVEKLNGDFAFAIFDARRRRLMLARDRMGVRPLHYAWHRQGLYFASEAKALLQVPGIEAELDPLALEQIFTFWFPLAPRTIFQGILELPPAHVLLATEGDCQVRPYWRLDYSEASETSGDGEVVDEVRELLLDATCIRLRADVPVGAYLSGGLDSSLVTAMASRLAPGRLRTFSVRFDDAEFDESAYQHEMAEALATEHSSVACTAAAIAASFPEVVRHAERPILRTAPAPLYMLSRLVRENGVKVVLTGEGADEVFGGYDIFKEAKVRRFCANQPRSQLRPLLFRRLYPYLPKVQSQSTAYLKAFFATDLDATADPLFSHLPRVRATAGAKLFFAPDLSRALAGYDALDDLRSHLPDAFSSWSPLAQAQYLETAFLLPGYILSAQGDRVSMAHAVEGRFPFLDHRVVELAARIPPRLKLKGLREKHVLREAAKAFVPMAFADRPKQPYRAPEGACFDARAPAYVERLLSPEAIAQGGLFDPRAVEKLHAKCRAGRLGGFRDNAAITGVLSTGLWQREFIPQAASDAAAIPQQAVA